MKLSPKVRYYVDYVKARFEKFDKLCLGAKPDAGFFDKVRYFLGFCVNYPIFGSTISDYFAFSFYNKRFREKWAYATNAMNHRFARLADSEEMIEKCNDKAYMQELAAPYLGRDYLDSDTMTYEQFCDFTDKHPFFLLKPVHGSRGEGVKKLHCTEQNREELFAQTTQEHALLDELIVQHPAMSSLCPSSVNTLRIYTYRHKDELINMGCVLRIGRGDSIIDNYSAGGLAVNLDPKTGTIMAPAEDIYGNRYETHPYTGVKLVGFQVPLWEQVLALVDACAADYPLNYVAWDIAVRENSCVIVEANPIGDFRTVQIAGGSGKRQLLKKLTRLAKSDK